MHALPLIGWLVLSGGRAVPAADYGWWKAAFTLTVSVLYGPRTIWWGLAAASLAARVDGVVVLKGDRTIVSDGQHHWTCDAGSVVLAVPGSGDVQAGVIASLLGQLGEQPPASVAALATQLHAMAGRAWERDHGPVGMLASKLADALPVALRDVAGTL